MNKKILILLLVTGVIFSIYGMVLAQDITGVGNSPIRMPASYALDDSNKAGPLINKLEPVKLSQNKERNRFDTNINLEFTQRNFTLADLFSTFKKVFFGIISALGIEV